MKIERVVRIALRSTAVAALVVATVASAQLFPKQNINGPVPPYRQDVFPYPGQCTSNPANAALVSPTIPACTGIPAAPAVMTGIAALPAVNPATGLANQTKWQFEVPNPVDFTAGAFTAGTCSITTAQKCGTSLPPCPIGETCNATTSPFDYYEISIAPAKNAQAVANLCVFPDPTKAPNDPTKSCYKGQTAGAWTVDAGGIPQGKEWTGLVNPTTKAPLYTPVWGFGQINNNGGPLAALAGVVGDNVNPVVVTWPSMSLRGTKGRPMIVKFVNQLPDQHLFCPYPLAWDWPCAIDRTLMGLKSTVDPARGTGSVPSDRLNPFGSPQQPDNAWTIHLHGGEIPPQSDGFAEKWFGNGNSGKAYSSSPLFVDPPYESPFGTISEVQRPGGDPAASPFSAWDRMTYYYPMVNEESTIWYHDHALGKTRINVAAGPAGFAPVEDPSQQGTGGAFAWLNPLRVKNGAGIPVYDLFLAIQDRAFNADGSINYPNGLGNPLPPPPPAPTPGLSPVTIGNNPQVHPQWVGEYFADHATVNSVLWPKVTVARGVYRLRLLEGSNARCYQLGFGTVEPIYSNNQNAGSVTRNVPFTVIADEQGYLPKPVAMPATGFLQMCPGERYEILIDFSAFPAGTKIWMNNTAPAPFPVGISPQQKRSPFAQMAAIMRFDVSATAGVTVTPPANTNPSFTSYAAMTSCGAAAPSTPCFSAQRQLYLNERIDPVTLTSLGLQINGVPFEYKVSETPKAGTYEKWDIINTTGDFHPMHLHLVKFQTIQRQQFSVVQYTSTLCGAKGCNIAGGGAGNMMQVVPDVTPMLVAGTILPPNPEEAGWKDTVQAPPGQVTTVIAKWDGSWTGAKAGSCTLNFPGVEAYVANASYNPGAPLCFEAVTNAPYVWHCHIVDHEDAEMMRSSLVVR